MEVILLIVGLGLLMYLCFKNFPTFIAAVLASLFISVTAGLEPIGALVNTYASGLGGYISNFLFLFILGALFGKMTDISGAADSIARAVVNKLGDKFIVPALILAGAILSYGGISVLVAFFTLYPIMVRMFQRANLPRYLLPAVYFAGAGTFTGWAPGSPQLQNLICSRILGTSVNASLVPGIVGVVFEAILVFGYMAWLVKHTKSKGDGYELTPRDQEIMDSLKEKKPMPALLALLPMIILLAVLNFVPLGNEFALFAGFIATLVCYWKYLPWNELVKHLASGTSDGAYAIFSTAAVVGVGSVVQGTAAFQTAIELVTSNNNINPLIMAFIAINVLCGFCGSGSGGLSISLPIIAQYVVPLGVNLEVLHRICALSGMGLDSLPHAGGVVMVLSLCGVTHRGGYKYVGIITVIIPLITGLFMLALYGILGY